MTTNPMPSACVATVADIMMHMHMQVGQHRGRGWWEWRLRRRVLWSRGDGAVYSRPLWLPVFLPAESDEPTEVMGHG